MQEGAREKVIVVDDDEHLRSSMERLLRDLGYEVHIAGSFEEALERAARSTPDHALVDVRLPGGNGIALIQRLRALNPAMHVVLCTAYPSIASAVQAVRLGADDYLPKPVNADQVRAAFDPSRRADPDAADPDGEEDAGPATAAGDDEVYSLARARWEHINFVLRDCGWNIAAAARRLNVHRQSLQRMLKKHPPGR